MRNAMKDWMLAATTAEQDELAKQASTSRWYLYQIARGRTVGADLAARIEVASAAIAKWSKGRLRILSRGQLCSTCESCPYFIACQIRRKK